MSLVDTGQGKQSPSPYEKETHTALQELLVHHSMQPVMMLWLPELRRDQTIPAH